MKLEVRKKADTSYRIVIEESERRGESPARLRWMAQTLFLIRAFEEHVLGLQSKNLVHGPVHTSIGQEAVATGVAWALRRIDKVAGTHRAHHQYLANV